MSRMADEGFIERTARGAGGATRRKLRKEIAGTGRRPGLATRCRSSTTRASPTASHSTQERARLIAVVKALRSNLQGRGARARADRRRHVRPVRAVRQADRSGSTGGASRGRCSASTASRSGDERERRVGPRVLLVVCDSFGVGDAPDAAAYGDAGPDTLGNTAAGGRRHRRAEPGGARARAPHRDRGRRRPRRPRDRARRAHRALGRQGHDDRALGDGGHRARRAVPAVPRRVPAGDHRAVRGARSAGASSATSRRRAPRSSRSSATSTSRTGTPDRLHERRLGVPDRDAHGRGAAARRSTSGAASRDGCSPASTTVGRVIARPFEGAPGAFVRSPERRDFSVPPPGPTLLDSARWRPASPCTASARSGTSSPGRA